MKNFLIILSILFCVNSSLFSQQYTDTELEEIEAFNNNIKNKNSHDTTIAQSYQGLSEILYISNLDTILPLCNKVIEISEINLATTTLKPNEKKAFLNVLSGALNNVGYVHKTKGNIKLALEYNNKSLKIHEETNDKSGIATSLNNIGSIYRSQGNLYLALEYYQKSLTLQEELGDKEGMASLYNNLGIIYYNQLDYDNALKYYKKTLAYDKETNFEKGLSNTYNNIGLIYFRKGQHKKALSYYNKSLALKEKIKDQIGIALCYNNIAEIFEAKNDLISAREYYEKALVIFETQGHKRWTGLVLKDLSELLLKLGEVNLAEKYARKSYLIAKKLGYPSNISHAAQTLSKISKLKGNYKNALDLFEIHTLMKDSILSKDLVNNTKQQQLKYEFEKNQAIKDAEYKKDLEILAEKEQRQKTISYGIAFVLIIVISLLVFIFNRLKVTKRQKVIIEEQSAIVETAKSELEEKNQEVIDSINYAKRIQDALLKSEEHESKHLPEHFVFFKPKDIVSGDFYWALEKDHHLYLAAADCTGHGVPGAFLTMLGNSFLNEINAVEKLLSPSEILNKLRSKIITELSQTGKGNDSLDGMDISLMRLDLNSNQLQWAGANNPLYIIKNEKLEIIKPDKESIGYNYEMTDFTNHNVDVKPGDNLYLFTDGFADQFGGPKGKKYMYKAFKEKLLSIHKFPINEQRELLSQDFNNWKGDLSQIDDVCVIGLRI
jgi:serine phosphatase RsbU (regulator of sigma subunit)/tetratricopeptide (TPR) repeat protein